MAGQNWWRGAVIYQIYPRSFLDTNGDGVGDLPGILARLDYIASLGVDAIWISPFFTSPMADFGYDIADYRGGRSAVRHAGRFRSRAGEGACAGPEGDDRPGAQPLLGRPRLVPGEPAEPRQPEGRLVSSGPTRSRTAPRPTTGCRSSAAWPGQWEPRRGQYYLHNFLSSQPDLNFHNPEVRAAQLDNLQFWLDRGVDGFRLDCDQLLVPRRAAARQPAQAERTCAPGAASAPTIPTPSSTTIYNNTQPENLGLPGGRCARCWTAIRTLARWAKSRPRIRWPPPPSTARRSGCTWATASSC